MEESRLRIRWLVLLALAVVWIAAVFARLSYLQLFCYEKYLAQAQRQQDRLIEVSPMRGVVYDRNGHELAMSIPLDSCFADPKEISDPAMVARLLSPIVRLPGETLRERLSEPKSFVWVARKLPPEMAVRIRDLNLRGIYFQKENKRIYPERSLAAQVLGYVDVDEHGLGGVEYSLDKEIRGQPSRMLVLADARRRWYDRSETAADKGANVVLTIDGTIQYIAEKELAAAIAKTHAKSGSIVIQDPNNGELLAVANWPTFDPNDPSAYSDKDRMDRAVSAAYEPGSTFKLITLAGAIAEGVAQPNEVVDCQMGSILVAGRLIHDWHPFGLLTVEQVLAHSSDVGAIKIALELGVPRFYRYIRAFGFGQLTGILLPGENHGLLRPVEEWTASSIGSLAIGQEVSVTPIQLISAVSAIANGGTLYRPQVVREVERGKQVLLRGDPNPRRILDAPAAATLRQMMEDVLIAGTGKLAQPAGYSAAGKTGTAQKIDPATCRYSATQYVASFVGFAPVNNPAVTILVVLDSPMGEHHGGDVAGPVFRRVAEEALARLDVPHDLPITPGLELVALRQKAHKESPALYAPRKKTASKSPRASAAMASTEVGAATTVAFGSGQGVPVPSFFGQAVRSVTETCSRLGLLPVLVGEGIAVDQTPEPGTRLLPGSRVIVRFKRASDEARHGAGSGK